MSDLVECPVCEVHFNAAIIEQHVEHCLKVQENKVATRYQSLKKDIQPGIGVPFSTSLGDGDGVLCLQTGGSPRGGIKGKKVTSPSQHGILKPKGQLDIAALLQGPKESHDSHKRKSKETFNLNVKKVLKTCSERSETNASSTICDATSLPVIMQSCSNPSYISHSAGSSCTFTSTTTQSLGILSRDCDPLPKTTSKCTVSCHVASELSYIDSSTASIVDSSDSSLDINIDCTDQGSTNNRPILQELLRNDLVQGGMYGNAHQSCPDTNVRLKSHGVARLAQLGRIPLAELMRPCSLSQYIGQTQAIGHETTLRTLIIDDKIPSIILWGPPGCGKTTLAHIVSNICKAKHSKHRFVKLSATTAGIQDVKDVVKVAKNELNLSKKGTVLFVDEIHRFNKLQQDAFLPHVENGTITLIGATTENPSFHVNNALLSRCRVVVLEKLGVEEVEKILRRAVVELHGMEEEAEVKDGCKNMACAFVMEQDSIRTLANLCDGDARAALNCLDLTLQSLIPSSSVSGVTVSSTSVGVTPPIRVGVKHIKATLQRSHVQYDRNGDEHYNIISALHKSIRGNDENATLYWLARMLEGGEQPLYIARRLVRCASEDIGLADPLALNQSVAAYQACHFIGRPECDVILAQAAVYLARAPKSVEVYQAYGTAAEMVRRWSGPQPAVPIHIRNAPTRLMRDLGYGRDYKYTPMCPDEHQEFLPPELKGASFFPSK